MALIIKEVLKQKNMQVSELAEKLGINRVSLSQQINGNPTVETLEKIAVAIGVSVGDLFSTDSSTLHCPNCGAELELKKKE